MNGCYQLSSRPRRRLAEIPLLAGSVSARMCQEADTPIRDPVRKDQL